MNLIPNITQHLFLPFSPELLISASANGLITEQIPSWLAKYLGKDAGDLLKTSIQSTIEPAIPGIVELVSQVAQTEKPVQGYQTRLTDNLGKEHRVFLDATPIKSADGSRLISINIQELPIQTGQEILDIKYATFQNLIGVSEGMRKVFNKIRMYGFSDAPVLIYGETGTGKEGVASALHHIGRRKNGKFVGVNCSAITETLFESELFGHEKGSFTGAVRYHRGRFERADGGTLFLDEIGDLPLSSQAKLLRAIEEEVIEPVGSERAVNVDVRIIAATNKNLEKESSNKQFRADLYYRIGALQIQIPPLRERIEDLELLIQHFITLYNKKYDRKVVCFTRDAIHLLKQYQWPGNVRELRNLIERLFAENQTEVISLRALKEWYEERMTAAKHVGLNPDVTVLPYRRVIPLGERQKNSNNVDEGIISHPSFDDGPDSNKSNIDEISIRRAFEQAGGNITRAAALLGIHKATFYRHLKNLNLNREDLKSGYRKSPLKNPDAG